MENKKESITEHEECERCSNSLCEPISLICSDCKKDLLVVEKLKKLQEIIDLEIDRNHKLIRRCYK